MQKAVELHPEFPDNQITLAEAYLKAGDLKTLRQKLDGMEKQINALSNLGLLARFVGMLTDSRSFLSYSRHEYFRRLLCAMLGRSVAWWIRRSASPRSIDRAAS